MSKLRVACVVGTRPDAIKTAPVVLELLRRGEQFETLLISTGQHREMLQQVFDTFGLEPQVELGLMKHGQSLAELTARSLSALDEVMQNRRPQVVLAQGDTTTTFVASLAAFYHDIPFGHIEAGLRTNDLHNPFPEEFNRKASAIVSAHHYAPTEWAAANLRVEGYRDHIYVTGNTGIDAVLNVANRVPQTWLPDHEGRVMLLTTHRRENWGEPMHEIAMAARKILDETPDLRLVVPMHRNPVVREVLREVLADAPRAELIEPPDYQLFVKLMQRSTLILTDSGGVQEEAPAFGIPVLVLRNTTERPEGVTAGCAQLVGSEMGDIVQAALALLSDPERYAAMARVSSPYGDGHAAHRIVEHMARLAAD